MRFASTALVLAVLVGCGSSAAPDAGGGMDAGSDDAGPIAVDSGRADSGRADSGAGDSGAGDAGARDAAAPDGSAGDSGIDCSTVGCGAPPVCGASCDAPCGCCACGGDGYCTGTVATNCTGACYATTECGAAGCVVRGGVAACNSCAGIEAEYTRLTETVACGGAGECQILFGHCGVGLGGCHYAVSTSVTQAELDGLAAQWTSLGCDAGRPVCRCAAPPTTVRCDAGGCLAP